MDLMARRLLALLAPLAACSFDGSGVVSAGPVDTSGESSGSASTTDVPTSDTTAPPTSSSPTSDPSGDPSGDPTTSPTEATTATDDGTTVPVDPTTTTDPSTGGPACGDGLAEAPEACDGADLAGQTCADFGLVDGTLACLGDCTVDLSKCESPPTCNNGQLDRGELCDGDDLGGETCESLGFFEGKLTCVDCGFDTSSCSSTPPDWYDEKFKKRRKLTIPAADVDGAHTDFPVAVMTVDMAIVSDLGDPDKLVFTTPDKSVLSHEIALREDDRLVAWVELKDLTDAADNEFYVYYGNPDASGTADAPATWSNKYLAVYHLEEDFVDEAVGGIHPDVTGQGHDGTEYQNHLNDTSCPVGRCQWFGPSDRIDLAKQQDFKLGNADVTISVWVRTSSPNARGIFVKSNPNLAEAGHLIVGLRNGGKASFELFGAGAAEGTTNLANNQHHQIVWTQTKDENAAQDRWRIYVDGKQEAEGLIVSLPSSDAHLARLASGTFGSSFPDAFQGAIDEVQVTLEDRSAAWISTAYANQRDPAGFTNWGPAETIP